MKCLTGLAVCLVASAGGAWAQPDDHPFSAFFGLWTLENDQFQQVWDGETVETLSIPGHLTRCEPLNTVGSVLCLVDAGGFEGHILWSVSSDGETVAHQSHFGTARLGDGEGRIDDEGNLKLRVSFSDEPSGTYRIYEYSWDGGDRYEMISRQYTSENELTGNWYGGAFVRVDERGIENANVSQ